MARLDHGTVSPGEPTPHAQALAGKGVRIEPGACKGGGVFARDADGEVAPPVRGEIQIEAAAPLPYGRDRALDELIGMNEAT